MKEIEVESCYHIISEPGDATRYDYYLHRDGPDEFTLAPGRSTFNFPARINYYTALTIIELKEEKEVQGDGIRERAQQFNCNPFTLLEVCRTIKEIKENEDKD